MLKGLRFSRVITVLMFLSLIQGFSGLVVAKNRGLANRRGASQQAKGQGVSRHAAVQRRVGPSAIKVFSRATREEREEFFDFLERLKGVPESFVFPKEGDDQETFDTKSVALLAEIDRHISDPGLSGSNWARRTRKHLKVKSGFSEWFKSINGRIKNLEQDVASIKKIVGSAKMSKGSSSATQSRSAPAKTQKTVRTNQQQRARR